MFPFDQPPPTALYLVLYMATMVMHIVPMNYVLAGSTYSALVAAWRAVGGATSDATERIAHVLRDWMPFALGVATAAAVAPLLFLQVLYKEPFYTANSLVFSRWMSILPALIVAFSLLCMQKAKRFAEWPAVGRAAVSVGVLLCFAYVAWSWTENHRLSARGQDVWTRQHVDGGWFYSARELRPRMALWFIGAFPTLASLLSHQLAGRGVRRRLAWMALAGLAGAAVTAGAYIWRLSPEVRAAVWLEGAPYALVALVGGTGQAVVWGAAARSGRLPAWGPAALTTAVVVTTLSVTSLRELLRLADVDITALYDHHAKAAQVHGVGAFLVLLAVNIGLITLVVFVVRRSLRDEGSRG